MAISRKLAQFALLITLLHTILAVSNMIYERLQTAPNSILELIFVAVLGVFIPVLFVLMIIIAIRIIYT